MICKLCTFVSITYALFIVFQMCELIYERPLFDVHLKIKEAPKIIRLKLLEHSRIMSVKVFDQKWRLNEQTFSKL